MRSIISRTLAATLLALFANLSVASACVRSPNYLQPSNYELVRGARAIVRAVAVDTTVVMSGYEIPFQTDERIAQYTPSVRFRIIEIIKGPDRLDSLLAPGIARIPPPDDRPGNDFRYSRASLKCFCCPIDWYTLGAEYLLFLDTARSGEWQLYGVTNARIAEPIADTNDPWYRTVRHYVAVDAIGSYDRARERLLSLQEMARRGDDPVDHPLAMAADIETHFSQPHQLKSYGDLVALLRVARDRYDTIAVLWALANGKHPEAIELVRQLVGNGTWVAFDEPLVTWLVGRRDTTMIGAMIAEYDRLGKDPEKTGAIISYLVRVAGRKQKPQMLALLDRADTAAVVGLAQWFISHPDPQVARLLKQYRPAVFGSDPIRNTLAELGDEEVVREAFRHQNDRGEYGLGPWPAYYIIGRSTYRLADSAFAAILKLRQDTLLGYIVQGLDYAHGSHRWARLRALAAVPDLPPRATYWLRRTLESRARKGEPEAIELLAIMDSRRYREGVRPRSFHR